MRVANFWEGISLPTSSADRRIGIASIITLVLASSMAVAGEDRHEPQSILSRYKAYAEEVSAECLKNRAYGLPTGGLPLVIFCEKEGNTAAIQMHSQPAGAQARRGGPQGSALPR